MSTLKGAICNMPPGWTAKQGYGKFNISGTVNGTAFSSVSIGYLDSIAYRNCISIYTGSSFAGQYGNSSSLVFSFTDGDDINNESLISWLSSQGELIEAQKYYLSGIWKFKNKLTAPIVDKSIDYINEEVSFVSGNNSSFNLLRRFISPTSGLSVEYANTASASGSITIVYADGEYGENIGLSGWRDDLDRTISFSAEQEVSDEFYNWMTANAYSLTDDKDCLIKYSTLAFIADSIKIKTRKVDKMTPIEMPNEILSIQTENIVAYNGEVEVK